MTSSNDNLKSLLSKFHHNDFVSLLNKWDCLPNSRIRDVDLTISRKNTVNAVMKICLEENVTEEDVGRLAVLFMERHSEKRLWTVMELKDRKDITKELANISNPSKFSESLTKQLNLYFNCITSAGLINGAIWTRVHFVENGNKNIMRNRTVYFVHYPQTSFIIITRIIAKYSDALMQAISSTLGYEIIVESKLTGHHVESLAKLSMNKNSKGKFSKHIHSKSDINPLSRAASKKRKVSHSDEQNSQILFENGKVIKKRKKEIDEKFGDEQPRLETIEYKMDLKLKGSEHIPGYSSTGPFRCHVKFEGSAVLEGLKNLGKVGLACPPLPRHLRDVNQFGKNRFVLADKT